MKEVKKKKYFFFMLKSVLKCIESIRVKKNRLNIFKFREPTWGEGGSSRVGKKPT